jgi:hypothetical protein
VPIVRISAVVLMLSCFLSSCSPLLSLGLYNNTSYDIEICNLQLKVNSCQRIGAHKIAAVLLVSDELVDTLSYKVLNGFIVWIYRLPQMSFWELRSPHGCKGAAHFCVAVQLQPDGSIYWLQSTDGIPTPFPPAQPSGFPLVPSA